MGMLNNRRDFLKNATAIGTIASLSIPQAVSAAKMKTALPKYWTANSVRPALHGQSLIAQAWLEAIK